MKLHWCSNAPWGNSVGVTGLEGDKHSLSLPYHIHIQYILLDNRSGLRVHVIWLHALFWEWWDQDVCKRPHVRMEVRFWLNLSRSTNDSACQDGVVVLELDSGLKRSRLKSLLSHSAWAHGVKLLATIGLPLSLSLTCLTVLLWEQKMGEPVCMLPENKHMENKVN